MRLTEQYWVYAGFNRTLERDNFDGAATPAKDWSAYLNHATVTGAMQGVPGKYGNACMFDGMDDKVEAPDKPSLDVTGDLSVEAWIYPMSTMDSRVVAAKWGGSGQRSYQLKLAGDKLTGSLSGDGSGSTTLTSMTSIFANVWTHVAMRRSGSELSLWINGVKEMMTATFTGNIFSASASLGIGWQADMMDPG